MSLLRRPGYLKRIAYRRGLRPKAGSVLFSPSLSVVYGFRDALASEVAPDDD